MADLGCQDTDWEGGNDKEVLDAILLKDGLKLATLSLDKGKYGYFVCISGWFGPMRGPPGSHRVDLGCQNTNWVGGTDTGFRCNFTVGWALTIHTMLTKWQSIHGCVKRGS